MTPSVQIGDLIAGRYRVERVLGVGGMGTVVAAHDVTADARCAVKLMHPEPIGSASWVERFRREAMVGASLRGEHAVRVLDSGGLDEGRPYLVMEHLDGTDLGKLLKKRGPLPFAEAALFVSQACVAVAEAHALGIVHRDLKPANLFFTRRPDGSPCVKVLDFGISKLALAGEDDALHMTKTGDVLGSPAYMAPEQIRAFSKVDPRSDVWALGVILYELCTGRWPFPGKASIELIAMVLERSPEPPRTHRPGLPADFEAVVMGCLQKDVALRTPSALALQVALAPYLPRPASDDDVTTVAPSPRSRSGAPPSLSPPSAATTAEPMVAGPHTTGSIAVARAAAGPSTRVVVAVAAAALTVIVVTLTALIRSPGASAEADRAEGAGTATAVAAAVESSAIPSAEPAPPPPAETVVAVEPVEASAPLEPGGPTDRASRSLGRAGVTSGGRAGLEPSTPTPKAGGRGLDPVAAQGALRSASLAAKGCKRFAGPRGSGRVDVTFATSGRVVSARVSAPFEGTATGGCILATFRSASVPSFEGSAFEASKTITIK